MNFNTKKTALLIVLKKLWTITPSKQTILFITQKTIQALIKTLQTISKTPSALNKALQIAWSITPSKDNIRFIIKEIQHSKDNFRTGFLQTLPTKDKRAEIYKSKKTIIVYSQLFYYNSIYLLERLVYASLILSPLLLMQLYNIAAFLASIYMIRTIIKLFLYNNMLSLCVVKLAKDDYTLEKTLLGCEHTIPQKISGEMRWFLNYKSNQLVHLAINLSSYIILNSLIYRVTNDVIYKIAELFATTILSKLLKSYIYAQQLVDSYLANCDNCIENRKILLSKLNLYCLGVAFSFFLINLILTSVIYTLTGPLGYLYCYIIEDAIFNLTYYLYMLNMHVKPTAIKSATEYSIYPFIYNHKLSDKLYDIIKNKINKIIEVIKNQDKNKPEEEKLKPESLVNIPAILMFTLVYLTKKALALRTHTNTDLLSQSRLGLYKNLKEQSSSDISRKLHEWTVSGVKVRAKINTPRFVLPTAESVELRGTNPEFRSNRRGTTSLRSFSVTKLLKKKRSKSISFNLKTVNGYKEYRLHLLNMAKLNNKSAINILSEIYTLILYLPLCSLQKLLSDNAKAELNLFKPLSIKFYNILHEEYLKWIEIKYGIIFSCFKSANEFCKGFLYELLIFLRKILDRFLRILCCFIIPEELLSIKKLMDAPPVQIFSAMYQDGLAKGALIISKLRYFQYAIVVIKSVNAKDSLIAFLSTWVPKLLLEIGLFILSHEWFEVIFKNWDSSCFYEGIKRAAVITPKFLGEISFLFYDFIIKPYYDIWEHYQEKNEFTEDIRQLYLEVEEYNELLNAQRREEAAEFVDVATQTPTVASPSMGRFPIPQSDASSHDCREKKEGETEKKYGFPDNPVVLSPVDHLPIRDSPVVLSPLAHLSSNDSLVVLSPVGHLPSSDSPVVISPAIPPPSSDSLLELGPSDSGSPVELGPDYLRQKEEDLQSNPDRYSKKERDNLTWFIPEGQKHATLTTQSVTGWLSDIYRGDKNTQDEQVAQDAAENIRGAATVRSTSHF